MNTSLLTAAKSGYENKVRRLLISGADIEAQDETGETALLLACDKYNNSHIDTMRVLLDNNANVDAIDDIGWTPLFWGCATGNLKSVSLLLEFGANVNVQDNELDTCLHMAIEIRHEIMIRLLLDKGADPLVKNRNGDTPLDEAIMDGTFSDSLMYHIHEAAEQRYAEQHTSLVVQMDAMRLQIDDLLEQCEKDSKIFASVEQEKAAFGSEKYQTINSQIKFVHDILGNANREAVEEEHMIDDRALVVRLGGEDEQNQILNVLGRVTGLLRYLSERVIPFICWTMFGAIATRTSARPFDGNKNNIVGTSKRSLLGAGLRTVANRMKRRKKRLNQQQQQQEFGRLRDSLSNPVVREFEGEEQDALLQPEERFRMARLGG